MRLAHSLTTLCLLALGCDSGDDSASDTGSGPVDPFEQYIDISDETSGDFSCYAAGDDWLDQTVDSSRAISYPADGLVEDFEDKVGVATVDLEVYFNDGFGGEADVEATSDPTGMVSIELLSCTPTAYKTFTSPELERTKDTYEAHTVYAAPEVKGGSIETEFNSVAQGSHEVILSLLGISLDESKSVIAGTAYDCADGKIEGAQVIVVDDQGEIPEGLVVNYFVDDWPIRDQPHTSADGLWVATSVPPGNWTVELWAVVEGDLRKVGATELETFANSINISNIYTGFDDGVKFPTSCLKAD